MSKWFPVWFHQQFTLKNGEVNANGYVEALVHGTTNHAPVYNYNDVEISNPIALNQYGRCQIKLSDLIAYDFVVYDENMGIDNTIENVRIPTTSGETGTNDHSQLINRDMVNQHPQSAITDLPTDLADKVSKTTATRQSIKSTVDFDYDESDSAFVTITTQSGDSRIDVGAEGGYVALNADNLNDPYAIVADGDGNTTATMYPHKNEYIGTDSYHKTIIGSSVREELYKLAGTIRMYWTKAINYSNLLYDSFILQRVADNKTLAVSERNVTDSMNRDFMSLDISTTDKKAISDIILTDGQASHKLTCGSNRAQLYSSSTETRLELLHDGKTTYYTEKGVNYEVNPETIGTIAEGQSQWNSTDHTLEIGMGSGVVQQIGQELPFPAKNVSGESFIDGQIGYVFGASGQRIAMKKPSASSDTALKALFMATQTVADNNTGFFNAIGLVRGLNTLSFVEGEEVWLDTVAGVITATPPAKPNYQARMGYVVNVHGTNGSIFFHPDIFPKIGDLSDCNTSDAVQGDFLTKGSDGVFKPNVFWDDWRWAGTAVNPPGVPVAAVLTEVEPNEWHWVFSNNAVMAFPDQQIPHDYKEGTDIIPHIHFCPTTTAIYTGTWTAVITLWESGATGAIKTTYTRTAAFNKSMTPSIMERLNFNDVISGTGRKISSCGSIQLSLSLSAGTSCALIGFDGHYQKDRFGSNSETSK